MHGLTEDRANDEERDHIQSANETRRRAPRRGSSSSFGTVSMTPRICPIALAFVCVTLCFGCGEKQKSGAPSIKRTPIFDLVATTPNYSNSIAAADRDLSGDVWTTGPMRVNKSRGQRLRPIAKSILEEIRPKLKKTSVVELIRCLKVEDGSGFATGYIGDEIYPQGNEMIIAEMGSRPLQERQTLLGLPTDRADLDTGSQGPPRSVDEVMREIVSGTTSGGVRR